MNEIKNELQQEKEIVIPIQGMTCAACASRIERVVGRLEGVSQASVNFATEKLVAKYQPDQVRLSEIKQTITKAGYTPLEIENKNFVDEDKVRKEKEIKTLWRKFYHSGNILYSSFLSFHGEYDYLVHGMDS